MTKLRSLKSRILEEGVDGQIDESEVALIRKSLNGGRVSPDDLEVLIELRSEAYTVCPAFDQLLFPALKAHILADGEVSLMEQFHLLKMLYGGGGVDDAEKKFLRDLKREVKNPTPEFQNLCKLALEA